MAFAYTDLQCVMYGLLNRHGCPYAQNSMDKKYLKIALGNVVLGTLYMCSTIFINYESAWYVIKSL